MWDNFSDRPTYYYSEQSFIIELDPDWNPDRDTRRHYSTNLGLVEEDSVEAVHQEVHLVILPLKAVELLSSCQPTC